MARLFGTDGVRGVANRELSALLAYRLGRAVTFYFGRDRRRPQIIIGRDTRISGEMLEAALAAGVCSAGGDAVLLGVVPTPAVAFVTKQTAASAGAMISASHNPFPDNGIKFFAADGYKLADDIEDAIELIVAADEDNCPFPDGENIGRIVGRRELVEQYIDHICRTVAGDLGDWRILVDCANGSASTVAGEIWRRLGVKAEVINHRPDGLNINDRCGSTHLDGLIAAVRAGGFDLGLAYDGDADRCLAVDGEGQVVDGDQLLYICACSLQKNGRLPENKIVATVMSNLGLFKSCRQQGIEIEVTPVGDRYVLERMRQGGWRLGGEQSGHIIFSDYSTTGDGILTSVQLLATLSNSGQSLAGAAAAMKRYPQVLVNVPVGKRDGWQENPAICRAIAEAEQQLAGDGRILVRASGTEPLIRVMVEGAELAVVERLARAVADVIGRQQQ